LTMKKNRNLATKKKSKFGDEKIEIWRWKKIEIWRRAKKRKFECYKLGANPTIASYNASAVKSHNATNR
jgi:hypothetical protein